MGNSWILQASSLIFLARINFLDHSHFSFEKQIRLQCFLNARVKTQKNQGQIMVNLLSLFFVGLCSDLYKGRISQHTEMHGQICCFSFSVVFLFFLLWFLLVLLWMFTREGFPNIPFKYPLNPPPLAPFVFP